MNKITVTWELDEDRKKESYSIKEIYDALTNIKTEGVNFYLKDLGETTAVFEFVKDNMSLKREAFSGNMKMVGSVILAEFEKLTNLGVKKIKGIKIE